MSAAVRPLAILAVTIGLAVATFLVVDARTDDVSGRTPGTAALVVVAIGIVVLVLTQRASALPRTESDIAAMFEALALRPIRPGELDDAGRDLGARSMRSGRNMTVLVVVLMVPALALQKPLLIVLGAIPIVGYGLVLAANVLRPGGTLDEAWQAADRRVAPLGLRGAERPDVAFVPRVGGAGVESKLVGPTVLRGERHGREVTVTIAGGRTETHIAAAVAPVRLKGHRQRVRVDGDGDGASFAVDALVARIPASARWTGMRLEAGQGGITVRRPGISEAWLFDLWLAERLAEG